jgi:hypothetical protein
VADGALAPRNRSEVDLFKPCKRGFGQPPRPLLIFHFSFLAFHFSISISGFPPDRKVLRSDGFSLGVAPFEPIFWAGISVGNSNSGVDFPLDNGIPLHRALRGFAYTRMTLGAIRLKSEAAETVL